VVGGMKKLKKRYLMTIRDEWKNTRLFVEGGTLKK
jgi:hypothetical protein